MDRNRVVSDFLKGPDTHLFFTEKAMDLSDEGLREMAESLDAHDNCAGLPTCRVCGHILQRLRSVRDAAHEEGVMSEESEFITITEIFCRVHPEGADCMDRFRSWWEENRGRWFNASRAAGAWLYGEMEKIRDEARRQALEEAAQIVERTESIDIGKMPGAIRSVKDRPTGPVVPTPIWTDAYFNAADAICSLTDAATTPARPAAAPASSPEPTDPAGRAS